MANLCDDVATRGVSYDSLEKLNADKARPDAGLIREAAANFFDISDFSFDIQKAKTTPPVNFNNQQSLCYAHSGMQLLFSCPRLLAIVFQSCKSRDLVNYMTLATTWTKGHELFFHGVRMAYQFMLAAQKPQNFVVRNLSVVEMMRERERGGQQDSKIFIQQLFEAWCLEGHSLLPDNHVYSSIMTTTFGDCTVCSTTFQTHPKLTKDLWMPASTHDGKTMTTQALVDQTLQTSEKVQFQCPACDQKTTVNQAIRVHTLAPYVFLNTNLLRTETTGLFQYKSLGQVTLDGEITIETCSGTGVQLQKRSLIGIIQHIGSAVGGHFTARCRRNGSYYFLDDTKSEAVRLDRLQGTTLQNVAVLLYGPVDP
jgi:ubiquitin C-terminal hydrolase